MPFLLMLAVLTVWLRYARRSFFWVTFFLLLLAPVMNIIPLPVALACRYLYLPQIGVWVLLAVLFGEARSRLVQRYWLPTIRAAVALERKDPNRAVELLQVAGAIELGEGPLLPVYLRGEAYLMLHDGSRAAAEFQKFIDHRGQVKNFSWGALARLGLARAYALQGDKAKARAAYRDFLTLWKDADPDIPILKEAKTEYANLQ